MIESDRNNFAAMLSSTMQTYLTPMTAGMADVWWNVLQAHDFAAVRSAMSDHIKDPEVGRWAPKPADIIGRLRVRPESVVPRLGYKKEAPDYATWGRIKAALKPQRSGQYWTPERVVNQRQVDFIKLQADHFGEMSMQGRFLRECQDAGVITHDYRLGAPATREPGEDTEAEVNGETA